MTDPKEQSEGNASGVRPEAAGSDLGSLQNAPMLPQSPPPVGVDKIMSGFKSGDDKVLQKVHELEAKHINLAVKQQTMEERVAKLEGEKQQEKVPSTSKPTQVPSDHELTDECKDGGPSTIIDYMKSTKSPANYDKEEWMVATLKQTQDGLAETAKLVQGMRQREEKTQQAAADTAQLMKTLLKDQQQMQKEQNADRARITRNEQDIKELNYKVERISSAPSGSSSLSAGSLGMNDFDLSEHMVQQVCITKESHKKVVGASSGEDELVVLPSQNDPGSLMHHMSKVKQGQSASAVEPSLERAMLMGLKKLEANQADILDAVKPKKTVSSVDPVHDAPVTTEAQEETAQARPGASKSTPPSF